MYKIKKKIIVIISFLVLHACGYSPIYLNQKDNNQVLKLISINGDDEINYQLENLINNYSKNNNGSTTKIYLLDITSNYSKNTISKDTRGNATVYLLNTSIKFEVTLGENKKIFNFSDSLTINNLDDEFEQIAYEQSIKENFALSIFQKFFIQISKFE
jgi:outer membrane lipopolysaccharide assembly protein LptE/RlpB